MENCNLELDLIDDIYNNLPRHKSSIDYLFNYIRGEFCQREAIREDILDSSNIFSDILKEADHRCEREETEKSIFITFPIKYVRDVILFLIYCKYHKIPYNHLDYAFLGGSRFSDKKIFIMYSKYSKFYMDRIKTGFKLSKEFTELVCISDGTQIYSGIELYDEDLELKEPIIGLFGVGSEIHIKINKVKKKDGKRVSHLEYIDIESGHETGFDDFE